MTSMTSEAPRAAPDTWKRPNLPPGASKEETKINIAKIQIIVVVSPPPIIGVTTFISEIAFRFLHSLQLSRGLFLGILVLTPYLFPQLEVPSRTCLAYLRQVEGRNSFTTLWYRS